MSLRERLSRSAVALERAFDLRAGDGARLLEYTHAFVLGLWQLSGCGRIVAEHFDRAHPAMLSPVMTDSREIQRALETLWSGVLASSRSAAATPRTSLRVIKNRRKRGKK